MSCPPITDSVNGSRNNITILLNAGGHFESINQLKDKKRDSESSILLDDF